jgi:hypothetical protein
MRMEVKVYMTHTDLARVQEAAKRSGEPVSAFMRRASLAVADALQVPLYRSMVLDGQASLALSEDDRNVTIADGGK